MKVNKGEIIELNIRKSGYTIKSVAQKMNISRGTLYKQFQEIDLSDEFILKLGKVIHHDFSQDLPHLKTHTQPIKNKNYPYTNHPDFLDLQKKYCQLLETYSRLLKVTVKICNITQHSNDLPKLQKQLINFIESNIQ